MTVTYETWRKQVEAELDGKPFEKVLVHRPLEGLPILPLYTQAAALPRLLGDGAPFRVCTRHGALATRAELQDELDGGADALWLPRAAAAAAPSPLPPRALLVVDEEDGGCQVGAERAALVSTLELHLAGADGCDEVAFALSAAAARLAAGARALVVRVAAGRETFVELCKLRALRLCLRKLFAARGGPPPRLWLHAVASPRTIAARDPWVNILRVTTELLAAVLGGADLVTPLPFDEALDPPSPRGRRLARNACHVLREEAGLGRVVDPGAGSYFLDSLTDALAREAWSRLRALEAEGGVLDPRGAARARARAEATRRERTDQLARRRLPLLGVSEFADPGEALPGRPRDDAAAALRDDAAFERLRARADALPPGRAEVTLVTVGPPADARARLGFAATFLAAGGLRARERGDVAPGAAACLCGSDAAYAAEAAARARALKAAGCGRLLLAGRPAPLEAALREAGVDDFLSLGCDAPAVLGPLLEALA